MTGSVFYVSSTKELSAAYAMLSKGAGGTIYLKDTGTPYTISFKGTPDGTAPVTITSADPNNPTTVSMINIGHASNVTVQGISVNSDGVERAGFLHDLYVGNSTNIVLRDIDFRSDATGFHNGDSGETLGNIKLSTNVTFENNTVHGYFHGLGIFESVGVKVLGNDISGLQADGIRMSGVQDVLIQGNHLHDFYGSPNTVNHDDMIQVWSTNATLLTKNVTITGNILNSGDIAGSQSIFFGNERVSGGHIYENIKITDNLIYNGHLHGIMVAGAKGVTIADNTLLWNPEAMIYSGTLKGATSAPAIKVSHVTNGVIEDNITARIIGGGDTVQIRDNVLVNYNSPVHPNYVGNHFVNAVSGDGTDIRDLRMLPDSPWSGKVGSSLSWAPTRADGPFDAVMTSKVAGDDAWTYSFSAEHSLDAKGYVNPADYKFVWTFEDGTKLEGVKVAKVFGNAEEQTVKLSVFKGTTKLDEIERTVDPVEKTLVKLDFNGAVKDASTYSTVLANFSTDRLVDGATGQGKAYLIGGSEKISIVRDNNHIHSLSSFRIDLDVALAKVGASGDLLSLPKAMNAKVLKDGTVTFSLSTDKGSFTVSSGKPLLTNTSFQKLSFIYDSSAGKLMLQAGGKTLGTVDASGVTAAKTSYGLTIGGTWGSSVNARVDNFVMSNDPWPDKAGTFPSQTVTLSTRTAEIAAVSPASSDDSARLAEAQAAASTTATDGSAPADRATAEPVSSTPSAPAPAAQDDAPRNDAPQDDRVAETPVAPRQGLLSGLLGREKALAAMPDAPLTARTVLAKLLGRHVEAHPDDDTAAALGKVKQGLMASLFGRETAVAVAAPAAHDAPGLHDLVPATGTLSEDPAETIEDEDEIDEAA